MSPHLLFIHTSYVIQAPNYLYVVVLHSRHMISFRNKFPRPLSFFLALYEALFIMKYKKVFNVLSQLLCIVITKSDLTEVDVYLMF